MSDCITTGTQMRDSRICLKIVYCFICLFCTHKTAEFQNTLLKARKFVQFNISLFNTKINIIEGLHTLLKSNS